MIKTAILIGSVRPERQSHKAAIFIERMLSQKGVGTDLIDFVDHPLPILEDRTTQQPQLLNTINNISERLRDADALIFVTPEYHGSFSGVLKNALDHYWSEFNKKPIGVVAVSSGRMGGINASTQLQHVILSLGAYPLPVKLLLPEIQNSFDQFNEPTNDRIRKSTNKFLDEFIWFSEAVLEKKMKEKVEKV